MIERPPFIALPAVALVAIAMLTACARIPSVSEAEAARIHAAAESVVLRSSSAGVGPEAWPEATRFLHPSSVRVASDGVYIVTSSWFVQEAGLFVPRHAETFSPALGGEPEHRRLHGAVFSYRIRGQP